jgi:hypothetical protein
MHISPHQWSKCNRYKLTYHIIKSLEMYASYTFPRYFGWGKAFELLILGKRLTAKEAFEAKFV